jgi:hypothetical protein
VEQSCSPHGSQEAEEKRKEPWQGIGFQATPPVAYFLQLVPPTKVSSTSLTVPPAVDHTLSTWACSGLRVCVCVCVCVCECMLWACSFVVMSGPPLHGWSMVYPSPVEGYLGWLAFFCYS